MLQLNQMAKLSLPPFVDWQNHQSKQLLESKLIAIGKPDYKVASGKAPRLRLNLSLVQLANVGSTFAGAD